MYICLRDKVAENCFPRIKSMAVVEKSKEYFLKCLAINKRRLTK